jgi:DNA-binding beta-propeller fold protein YncE
LEIDSKNTYALNKRKIVREQLYKQLTYSKGIKHIFEKAWYLEIKSRYVAVDSKGYVYVPSTETKTITYRKFLRQKQEYEYYSYVYKFDNNGNFITKWGSEGTGDGEFKSPEGITVDSSSGYVYVADSENSRIQKFDNDGNFITKWGSKGTGDGEFNYPYGITVDSSSCYVYIVDSNNHRIQVFAPAK